MMLGMNDRLSDSEAFVKNLCGFDDSIDNLFASVPNDRQSGTGSPSSLDEEASMSTTSHPKGSLVEDATKSFPIVLHAIVSDPASDGCVHWLSCGTRFVIADKDAFSERILPRYFGGRGGSVTKFTSFTRRLKRWNFSRVPSGREMGAYYHGSFRKNEPELAKTILYPANTKSQQATAGRGGENETRKPTGGGGGTRPKTVLSPGTRATLPKARRRASTGSISALSAGRAITNKNKGTVPTKSDVALLDISPTPFKRPLIKAADVGSGGRGGGGSCGGGAVLPLPDLENDMTDWLSGAGLMDGGGRELSPSHEAPAIDPGPAPIISNPSVLPPPPSSPAGVFLAGSAGQDGSMMKHIVRPAVAKRRHSAALDNLNLIPASMCSGGANVAAGAFAFTDTVVHPSQVMGVNFACNPQVVGSAMGDVVGFGQNVSASTTVTHSTSSPQPQRQTSGADEDFNDPFSFSRDFSFDDLKMIDPFT